MRFLHLLTFLFVLSVTFRLVSGHGGHDHSHDDEEEGGEDEDSAVNHLTKRTFKEFINSHDRTLVEFYAPWCGHCKALKPHYEAAAKALKDVAPLAAVDCTTDSEKELCSKYGVQGFPTLKLFVKGLENPIDYKAGRTEKDIVNFMKKQSEPAVNVIADEAAFNALKDRADVDVLVVGYFAADSNDAKSFTNVANILRNDYTFALITDAALAGSAAIPSVVLHKLKSEPGSTATHAADFSEEAISAFVSAEAFPLFGEIGPENFQKFVERGIPIIWFFLDYDEAITEPTTQIAENIAKEFKGQVSLVRLDGVKWAEHAKHFGLDASKLPGIVAEDREDGKNFVFNQDSEISEEALRAHIRGFLDGTLAPTVKSQPAPATQAGPVFTLVGSTFQQEVIDNDKDVLVEFYAPWCGHCKQLAPKYEKLAKKFADNPNVRIAAMDATENDAPGVKIKGFPTLYFYPAGQKNSPKQYEGDRTEEALEKYIKTHGTTFKNQQQQQHDEL